MSNFSHVSGELSGVVGLLAATLTTISFLPQVIRLWRTRRGEDISSAMFIIFSIGTALWLVYGVLISSLPVTLANSVTLALSFVILFLKWKWRSRLGDHTSKEAAFESRQRRCRSAGRAPDTAASEPSRPPQ